MLSLFLALALLIQDPPTPAPVPPPTEADKEAAELLMMYSYPDDLARLVDEDRSKLRLMLRLNKRDSADLRKVADELEHAAVQLGFAPGSVHATSTLYMIATSLDEIAYQMAVSIFTSVIVIIPAMMILAKSARTGLIAMIPNMVPSFFVFGFMGFLGYRLVT